MSVCGVEMVMLAQEQSSLRRHHVNLTWLPLKGHALWFDDAFIMPSLLAVHLPDGILI